MIKYKISWYNNNTIEIPIKYHKIGNLKVFNPYIKKD